MKTQVIHYDGTEFGSICHRCKGKIIFVREGSFLNEGSDITECSCAVIEHHNGLELMSQKLTYGTSQILEDKWDKKTKNPLPVK